MKNILFKYGMGDVWEQYDNTESDIVDSSLVKIIHQRIIDYIYRSAQTT